MSAKVDLETRNANLHWKLTKIKRIVNDHLLGREHHMECDDSCAFTRISKELNKPI